MNDDTKWRMVAALYNNENFTKSAIKKQQLEKLVSWLNAINCIFQKLKMDQKFLSIGSLMAVRKLVQEI